MVNWDLTDQFVAKGPVSRLPHRVAHKVARTDTDSRGVIVPIDIHCEG